MKKKEAKTALEKKRKDDKWPSPFTQLNTN